MQQTNLNRAKSHADQQLSRTPEQENIAPSDSNLKPSLLPDTQIKRFDSMPPPELAREPDRSLTENEQNTHHVINTMANANSSGSHNQLNDLLIEDNVSHDQRPISVDQRQQSHTDLLR